VKDTLVLIIGVSRYPKKEIPDLPAAERDAMTLARSLVHWGIPESNVLLLLNEEATIHNLATTFKALSLAPAPRRLLLYFVGHGVRKGGESPTSSLQFFDKPLSLDKLVGAMGRLDIEENILVIDACNLRINHFEHPQLRREIAGMEKTRRSFFCLFSSGIERSYEDQKGKYGYFTDALLRALGRLRGSSHPPEKLVALVERDLEDKGLPIPESVNMGLKELSLFPKLNPSTLEGGEIHRPGAIAALQESLVEKRPLITHLVGDKGSGKSIFARQLASDKLAIRLASVDELVTDPYDLLIFDHLAEEKWEEVYQFAAEKQVQAIIISERLPSHPAIDPLVWKVPPFDINESRLLIAQHRKPASEDELLHLFYGGDPGKLAASLKGEAKPLLHLFERPESILAVASAIVGTGGFINQALFASIFNLSHRSIDHLKMIGWIMEEGGFFLPHPHLYEVVEREEGLLSKEKVIAYWCEQIRQKPEDELCAKHFLATLGAFGVEKGCDPYLRKALHTLVREGSLNREILHLLAPSFFAQKKLTEGGLVLAEALLYLGDLKQAYALLQKVPRSKKLLEKAVFLQLRLLLRSGSYQKCVQLGTQLQKGKKSEKVTSVLISAQCLVGDWASAADGATMLVEKGGEGWGEGFGLLVLGKIKAQEGEHKLGKELIEKSVQVFERFGEKTGVAMGMLGLAEMCLSLSQFSMALAFLKKGKAAGRALLDPDIYGETLKTTLLVQLHVEGPRSPQLKESIDRVCSLETKWLSHKVEIDLLDALIQVHLARGEYKQARQRLKELFPKVRNSHPAHLRAKKHFALIKTGYGTPLTGALRAHASPIKLPSCASSPDKRVC